MKDLLTFMNKNGISSSSDGLLRDQVVRGLWTQAAISCQYAIERREKEIGQLKELLEKIKERV